jgi:ribosomal protein L11 methyltransferase
MCLELIETILEEAQTDSVIDIGCGSAILSIAAIKLGARQALGVDIDHDAIQAAKQNTALNDIQGQIELRQGSLAEIQAGAFSLGQAPLVITNILAPVIVRLLNAGLGELLSQNGKLVLSGILEEQRQDVEQALVRNGLQLLDKMQFDDWLAILAQPKV